MLGRLAAALRQSRFAPAEVTRAGYLTPHMIRLTLRSDVIRDFPTDCAGGHFKLVVPEHGQSPEAFAAFVQSGNLRSAMRTYTIRRVRPEAGEIDVDIVTHGDLGRVGPWAQRAEVGNTVVISRPGAAKLVTGGADRVLAAADMTGFPALAAGLETLPDGTQVDAYVEILSEDDKQPVDHPSSANIHWVVKNDPYAPSNELIEAVKSAEVPRSTTSVFIAAEFSAVGDLRQHFTKDIETNRALRYISSYWKAGTDEMGHKRAKSAIG